MEALPFGTLVQSNEIAVAFPPQFASEQALHVSLLLPTSILQALSSSIVTVTTKPVMAFAATLSGSKSYINVLLRECILSYSKGHFLQVDRKKPFPPGGFSIWQVP